MTILIVMSPMRLCVYRPEPIPRFLRERLPCALCGSYAGTPAGTVRGSFGSTAVPSPAATDPVL